MSNMEFGRGRDKRKRKSRRRNGTVLAATGLAGSVATVGGAVLWAKKKRPGSGIPGVPGFDNSVKALTGDPLGDSQRVVKAAIPDGVVKTVKSTVSSSDEFAKTFIPQSSRSMSDAGDLAKSSYEGVKNSRGSLVTSSRGKMTQSSNGYRKAPNPVVDVFRGLDKTSKKVVGTMGHAKRRAKADILVMKKMYGR